MTCSNNYSFAVLLICPLQKSILPIINSYFCYVSRTAAVVFVLRRNGVISHIFAFYKNFVGCAHYSFFSKAVLSKKSFIFTWNLNDVIGKYGRNLNGFIVKQHCMNVGEKIAKHTLGSINYLMEYKLQKYIIKLKRELLKFQEIKPCYGLNHL